MINYDNLINSIIGDNVELVLRFFIIFSRFEYALKRAGYVKSVNPNSNVDPDWERFIREKGDMLLSDMSDTELKRASDFLLRHPPQKQIFVNSGIGIGWKNNERQGNESEAVYLLKLVKCVRNNLFHGGKYPDALVNGQALRNSNLLLNCLTILEKSISLDTEVKRFFEDTYDA